MAERVERSFYTIDETLWEALKKNDAIAENDPHLEADSSSDKTDCESDPSSCTDEIIDKDVDTKLILIWMRDRYLKE